MSPTQSGSREYMYLAADAHCRAAHVEPRLHVHVLCRAFPFLRCLPSSCGLVTGGKSDARASGVEAPQRLFEADQL